MNFVQFPDIIPSSMDFVAPRFPVGSDTSLGGLSTRRKFGNRQYDGRLTVEFRNISNYLCAQVLLTCINSKGLAPIAFYESFFRGAGDDLKLFLDGSAYPGLLWYFIEDSPPRINRVEGGAEVSNMSMELAARLMPDSTGSSTTPILPAPLPTPGGPGGGTVQPTQYITSVSAEAPLSSTGGTDPVLSLPMATQTADGGMSKNDKLKLDNIEVGAQPNVPTNLAYTPSTRLLTSSTGADVTLPVFTATTAGLVPLSGGGTTKYLRADGEWATPPGGGGGGELTISTQEVIITKSAVAATVPIVNPTAVVIYDSSADEDSFTVPIGFSVNIFGASYTSVFINSNSYFTFGGMVETYGESSYENWMNAVPYPGVFIGSDDGSIQRILSTGAIGTPGTRTNTIRFQGSVEYNNYDPDLSDLIWEITFKENEPEKIYLNLINFNQNGNEEGVNYFTFISTAGVPGASGYTQFEAVTGGQYLLTLSKTSVTTDYTGSSVILNAPYTTITQDTPSDPIEISIDLARYVASDITAVPSSQKIVNLVSLSQSEYDSISQKDPSTLYVIVG